MALKIWNIGTANKRIEALEAEVASLQEKLTKAESAVSENTSEAVKAADQLQADLNAANAKLSTMAADLATAQSSATASAKQVEELNAKLATKDEEVKIKVSQQAASVQAALGQPAAPVIPDDATRTDSKPGANGRSELKGIDRLRAGIKAELDKNYPPRN